MSTTTQSSSGIGFAGMLTILFIGLKLAGIITWSWWWVLCPLWIGIAFVLGAILIFFVGFLLTLIGMAWMDKPKKPTESEFQTRLKNMRKR